MLDGGKKETNPIIQQLEAQSNFIYKSLVEEQDVNILPEPIFVQHFLPYFSGQVAIDETSTIYAEWLSVSGGPHKPVDIIDQHGNVLYRVPPVYSTYNISTDPDRPDIASIIIAYSQHESHIPGSGESMFHDEIKNYLDSMDVETREYIEQWTNIFRRYGLIQDNAKDSNNIVDDDDILEY